MHPVEHLPKVRVMDPHALQGDHELMVAFGFGEPPQSLLLGQVIAFAHGGVLPSFECSIIPSARALAQVYSYPKGVGQRALAVNFALTEFYEGRKAPVQHP